MAISKVKILVKFEIEPDILKKKYFSAILDTSILKWAWYPYKNYFSAITDPFKF